MQESTTFSLMLSPTPRRFTVPSTAMNTSATMTNPVVPQLNWKAMKKLAAKNRDAAAAEVMPAHITTKARR